MLLLTGAGKTWQERASLSVVHVLCQHAVAKRSNMPVIRHARSECRHDAQYFALPNFNDNRHVGQVTASMNSGGA
jgi:hypothetical protein